jgi:hypothetical protein
MGGWSAGRGGGLALLYLPVKLHERRGDDVGSAEPTGDLVVIDMVVDRHTVNLDHAVVVGHHLDGER